MLPHSPSLDRLKQIASSGHFSGRIDEFVDECGSGPLAYCVGPANADTIKMIDFMVHELGADVSRKDSKGRTPLTFARCWQTHNEWGPAAVARLLELGAK
eukprot:TRINITY_DN3983_c0_g1_i1.p6 TRINITY_DN3983_c0_g1~~TRINITY_DN3983_c0_g1_i1.p6  ORF type:complete len:100 (+),score=16.15 TRINITY_DN3983_c0_g1_i1:500-799(+)